MWVKLDDGFAQHPKVVGLGPEAFVLHVAAMCYCGRYETDGWVPKAVIGTLSALVRNPKRAAVVCVAQGVWEDHAERYRIHDWDEYQPSREEREHQRERNRKKQESWRERNRSRNRGSNRVTNRTPDHDHDPTRPDPNYDDREGTGAGPASPGSSSWSPERIRDAWNATVPGHMHVTGPPGAPEREADWPAVFAAVARNRFLCGEGRDLGPATLPWVLAHPDVVLSHDSKPAEPERSAAQRRRL